MVSSSLLRGSLYINKRSLTWVLPPLVPFFVGFFLINVGGFTGHVGNTFTASFDPYDGTYHRLLYYAALMLFSFCGFAVCWMFFVDIIMLFQGRSIRRVMISYAALACILFVAVIVVPYLQSSEADDVLGRSVFASLFEIRSHETGLNLKLWFDTSQHISNFIASLAAPAAVVGAVTCLGQAIPGTALSRAEVLTIQIFRLRRYLYAGALLLATGILLQISWMLWPNSGFGDGGKSFTKAAQALATVYGVTYSVALASYYLPCFLTLNARVEEHAKAELARQQKPITAEAIDRWKMDLGFSFREEMKSMLALLTPLLTGSIGTLLGALKG